ncbi:MAG TPA: S8 family serine peptidase, partial [Blastocatellia bacterium]|nr:S8 family serine peptidase [Blastocatellia bacterium]
MTKLVCPKCNTVTPRLLHCMACNAFLGDLECAGVHPPGEQLSFWRRVISFLRGLFGLPAGEARSDDTIQMDPHLRRLCARIDGYGIAPAGGCEDLAVVAKVKGPDAFAAATGVRIITSIGPTPEDATSLVTARISAKEVERLRNHPGVVSLKATRLVRASLENTRRELFEGRHRLGTDAPANSGSGVIIGVVDFGLDFVHRNFRKEDGNTRVLALWDQNGKSNHKNDRHPFGYGRLISQDMINSALASENPYEFLGYQPSEDSVFDTGAHGTYVADIAAGNGLGSSCKGIAPDADIVFVDLS